MTRFYDLASLTKPLVTAPQALAFLDLDVDRRWALGFHDRDTPLTVRQLRATVPQEKIFAMRTSRAVPAGEITKRTGEPMAVQLRRGVAGHPLLRPAPPGLATYSDLNYRLLAELLEAETGVAFMKLGAASGLSPAPWSTPPAEIPDGPDAVAWPLATEVPLPARSPWLPHDANARAGMLGHAGFGAAPAQRRPE